MAEQMPQQAPMGPGFTQDQGLISQAEQQGPNVDQAMLEEYVIKGYNLIYDEKSKVVNLATQNPATKIKNVAQAGLIVAKRLDQSKQKEGRPPFPDEIKALGGFHLVDKLIEFAEYKGSPKFSDAEKQEALKLTFQTYMQDGIKNRTIDPVALAQGVEAVQPGLIEQAMAGLPDTPPGKGAMPQKKGMGVDRPGQAPPLQNVPGVGAQAPQSPPGAGGQPGQAPAVGGQPPQQGQPAPQPQGLLNQPSPLARFL